MSPSMTVVMAPDPVRPAPKERNDVYGKTDPAQELAREIRTMADISISPLAPREFRVQVREGDRETTHQVTVPERLGEGLELRDDDLERVVRESFRFLLERERATSILAHFSLSDISRYFPEYPSELARRLS
jgi:hypothetical protein